MTSSAFAQDSGTGDQQSVIVPDLSKESFRLKGNEERVMERFGLHLKTSKFVNGTEVQEFPIPADPGQAEQSKNTTTQCRYVASHQSPEPGQEVSVGSEISIRLTQTCEAVVYN